MFRVASALVTMGAAAVLLSMAGCTSASSVPTRATTSSPISATAAASSRPRPSLARSSQMTARPRTVETQAIQAYLGMWSDFTTAGHTSDWQSSLLSQHATAYALQVLEKSLYIDHNKGVVTKGAPVLHPKVKSVSPVTNPTVVLISDCGDSGHWLKYSAKTGKLIPGSPGGRQAITAEVRKQPDRSWKVDQFAVEGTGTC